MTTGDKTSGEDQAALRDRVAGVMIGTAVGDALGAGYEFGSAPLGPGGPDMIGGGLGGFAPGQWTDDTTMAWCVLDAASRGDGLLAEGALTTIARHFRRWYDSGPSDIGNQTRAVLHAAGSEPTAAAVREAAVRFSARHERSAGNGSLMRTAPVALAHLGDREAIARAATEVSALTHADPSAGQACLLWSLAIDRAVRERVFDIRSGLAFLDDDEARSIWASRIGVARRALGCLGVPDPMARDDSRLPGTDGRRSGRARHLHCWARLRRLTCGLSALSRRRRARLGRRFRGEPRTA
ncbi:ADP-ribosylglycohydrolase family protein [Dietzia sp. NPDC055343]